MQISTQPRKRLMFAALFLALLIPLFFAFALRAQLPRSGDDSPLITWVHQNMTSGFWMKDVGDSTGYSIILLDDDFLISRLLILQCYSCFAIALVLLWLTFYCKKSYLVPFTVAYTILSALIFLATMGDCIINAGAGQYCAPMLWGAYLREGRGIGSLLVYLAVAGCYFVSLARSRKAA